MIDFDKLNKETREYNSYIHYDTPSSSVKYGTSEYWRNYWNNQTYKQNNGEYSNHY